MFAAQALVLATGGAGKCWRITSNSWECTGDGHALAYEAGAELVDMEFVQFHPTGMVWPPGVVGLLVTEAVRGEGGILRNADGERFMERYDPKRLELSTRDVVARAIYTEVKEGRGTPHGGVLLDVSHLPADTSSASCRACTTSSWSSPASTSRASRWRSVPPATTSWAASASTPRPARARFPGSSPPASARAG